MGKQQTPTDTPTSSTAPESLRARLEKKAQDLAKHDVCALASSACGGV